MQTAAPELIDLSKEKTYTLKSYGVDRKIPAVAVAANSATPIKISRATVCSPDAWLSVVYGSSTSSTHPGIITVDWTKNSNNNASVVDQPIAALIRDLKQRGLLDSTMVQWSSEFGARRWVKTRGGNKNATGRDHHPFCFSMLMAGGGFKGGHIYGKTDEIGWNVVEKPVHPNDLHATMLHCFGLDHEQLTTAFKDATSG